MDETDLCYLGGFPGGKLKDVFGLTADEIDTIFPSDTNSVVWDGSTYPVVDYCELITPTTAQVLGTYGSDFYEGMPALLKNNYQKGTAYYIGCRDTGELSDKLYEKLLKELDITAYDLPEGVTIHSRENYFFVQNFNYSPVTVNLPGSYRNMETEALYNGSISIEGSSIVVLEKL